MNSQEIKERAWKIAVTMVELEVAAKSIIILVCLSQHKVKIHLVPDPSIHEAYFLKAIELAEIYCLKRNDWVTCPGERCKHKSWPHFGPNHEGEFK